MTRLQKVAFFGIPVFGGLSIFVGAFFYFKKYDVVVPPTIIAYATQVPFVLGLVGISYAILSSSWDYVSDFSIFYSVSLTFESHGAGAWEFIRDRRIQDELPKSTRWSQSIQRNCFVEGKHRKGK